MSVEKPTTEKSKDEIKNEALEKLKQKVSIVNVEDLAEKEIRDSADAYMTMERNKSGRPLTKKTRIGRIFESIKNTATKEGVENLAKKFWKHTLFDEYYRQREINRVRAEVKETGNIYTRQENDVRAHEQAMQAVVDRFTSEYDELVKKDTGEEKKTLDEKDPETKKTKDDIKKLITDYAAGKIDEDGFKSEKGRIIGGLKKEDVLKNSDHYADNLFELAKNAKLALEHGAKLEELDLDFDLIIGKAKSSIKTEANLNYVDRVTDKMKKSKIGRFVNPATLTIAVGIAYCIAINTSKKLATGRAAQIATLGGAALAAGAFAGMNESQRIANERRQHGREMAKGGSFEAGDKRREEMQKLQYDMMSANDLAKNLKDVLFTKDPNGKETPKTDLEDADIEKIFASLSNIEARNSLSDTKKIDLISYSSVGNVEKERTELDILTAQTKVELRKRFESDLKDKLPAGETFDSYLEKQINANKDALLGGENGIDAKDKSYRKYKAKRVAGKVTATIIAGLTIGTAAQEIKAVFDPTSQGVFEGMLGSENSHLKTMTPLEELRGWIGGNPSHIPAGNIVDAQFGNANFHLPEGSSMVHNPDGSFNIMHGDRIVADHIALTTNPDGTLTPSAVEHLGEHGIISTSSHEVVDGTKEVTTTAAGYLHGHGGGTHHIVRDLWYDNNTPKPVFDQNELKLWWGGEGNVGTDAQGNYTFNVSHMTQGGSFHENLSVDAQEKIKNGGLKILLSLSRDTQNQVFEVPIDANGNASVDPNSEIGKLFFGSDGHGHTVFKGRFAEVAEMFGSKDGTEHVKILSTFEGPGNDNIKDIIPTHIDTPVNNLELPLGKEPQWFLPVFARRPLEPIVYKDFNTSKEGGLYGYGEGGEYGLLNAQEYQKRLSKKLKENKEYDLSGNDKEIIDEYLSKQDKQYLKELEGMTSASPAMSKNIETVITVPAYQEGKNLEKTIRNYAKLKDREKFELVIFENHPADKERDDSKDVINRMKQEFPDMNIVHIYKSFDQKPAIGEVRKYLVDSVLLRKQKAGIDNSIAIASNDADLEDISEDYIKNISDAFKKNKRLDAIAGKWDYPEKDFEKLPILHASQRLWHYFDIVFRYNFLKSPDLIGRNSAFRSGAYAAIGGYNEKARLAEDLEIGWMIKNARNYDSTRISYLNKAGLVSNSRRAVTKMLSGGRLIDQYGDFHENEEVRNKSLEELLKDKKDFDPETFGKEAQSIYNYYARWKKSRNGWIDDAVVDETFDRAMRFMGVKYEKSEDKITITDTSGLEAALNKNKTEKAYVKHPEGDVSEETHEESINNEPLINKEEKSGNTQSDWNGILKDLETNIRKTTGTSEEMKKLREDLKKAEKDNKEAEVLSIEENIRKIEKDTRDYEIRKKIKELKETDLKKAEKDNKEAEVLSIEENIRGLENLLL